MPDLTGTLSQVGSVVLDKLAATKYNEMVTAFGSDLLLQSGYVSEWDWYAEMLPCVYMQENDARKVDFDKFKALTEQAEITSDQRVQILNFMGKLSKADFDMTKYPTISKAWTNFKSYKLNWRSPFFKKDNLIHGWPNSLNLDPRRSGKLIIFQNVEGGKMEWLLENSYKYGFVWYGPTDETFLFVGDQTFSEDFIQAALMGIKAPIYQSYKVANGKKPETKQEITDWVNLLPDPEGSNGATKTSLSKAWLAWEVMMDEAYL